MNQELPSLGSKAFICPHCSVFTTQEWHFTFTDRKNDSKQIFENNSITQMTRKHSKQYHAKPINKIAAKHPVDYWNDNHLVKNGRGNPEPVYEVTNLYISECLNCQKIAIWSFERMIFPSTIKIQKNLDIPDKVQQIYDEANEILDGSPRGATALLRLAVQELLVFLGKEGKNLNTEIKELVKENKISPKVQKALDIVRVTGNDAVHPGQIFDFDSREIAEKLFGIVNFIVQETITTPSQLDKLYQKIPDDKRRSIEERDK